MPTEILYVRIDTRLKNELNRLATESALPLKDVAEIVIARGLGMESSTPAARVKELLAERYGTADGKDT